MSYVIFDATSNHIDLWKSIFLLLEDGSAAANLQDKMKLFGKDVDEKLEKLIGDYGVEEAFRVEFWSHNDTEFSAMIFSPDSNHEVALLELLSLCPVNNLRYEEGADW